MLCKRLRERHIQTNLRGKTGHSYRTWANPLHRRLCKPYRPRYFSICGVKVVSPLTNRVSVLFLPQLVAWIVVIPSRLEKMEILCRY